MVIFPNNENIYLWSNITKYLFKYENIYLNKDPGPSNKSYQALNNHDSKHLKY